MPKKPLPTAVIASTRVQADLDALVRQLGHKTSAWKSASLKKGKYSFPKNPGVYCFVLPESALPKSRQLVLHGRTFGKPGARYQLQVTYVYEPKKLPGTEKLVVYVGKATNISNRIAGHLSANTKATTNQVLRGLVGLAHHYVTGGLLEGAKKKLQRYGAVYFLEHFHGNELVKFSPGLMAGECHVAERDLLEIKLIAAFAPPFNVKAER